MSADKLKANEWVGHVQVLMKGKGGGSVTTSQATGTNISALRDAVKAANEYAAERLSLTSSSGCTKRIETLTKTESSEVEGLHDVLDAHLADRSYIIGMLRL